MRGSSKKDKEDEGDGMQRQEESDNAPSIARPGEDSL